MIVSRTPFRVSMFGGGSDYPAWYRRHGGRVLGFAVNKYCYISVRRLPPFFEHKHRIVYSNIENVREINEIKHPSVRAVLGEMYEGEGLEIHHDGDLPARSGLGSSSSFTVGLINALHALNGRMVTKAQLAEKAIHIEQEIIREHVGSQDQIWAAFGGLNRIDFVQDGQYNLQPLILPSGRQQELMSHLVLYFTGISRIASQVAEKKIANLDKRSRHIRTMVAMVDEAQYILQNANRPISELGELLHQSWQLKRELTDGVTTDEVDSVYAAARESGAVGGKLLGAGGGGFMLFFVPPNKRPELDARLSKLIPVNIGVDVWGSKIVVYEPDGLQYC